MREEREGEQGQEEKRESADDGAAQVADTAPWELCRIHQATRHPGPSITFSSSSTRLLPRHPPIPRRRSLCSPLPPQSPTSVTHCHSCPLYTSTRPPDPAGARRLAAAFITQPPSSADRPSSCPTLTALAHTTLALSRSLSPCSRLIPATPEEDRPFLSYAPSAGLVSLSWVLLPPDRLASAHRRLEGCEHSADSSTLVPPYNPRVRHPSVFHSYDAPCGVIWNPFGTAHSTSFPTSRLIM